MDGYEAKEQTIDRRAILLTPHKKYKLYILLIITLVVFENENALFVVAELRSVLSSN